MKNRKTKNRLPPFLPLYNETLDAPATKALSHGAFRLYAVLKRSSTPTSQTAGMVASIFRNGERRRKSVRTEKRLRGGIASFSTTASS